MKSEVALRIMIRTAAFALGLAVGVAAGSTFLGCSAEPAEEDAESEGAASTRSDSIGAPTDTGVTLALGLWKRRRPHRAAGLAHVSLHAGEERPRRVPDGRRAGSSRAANL